MKIILCLLVLLLNACSSLQVNEFTHTKPSFKIEEYFLGTTTGKGIVLDRSGRPNKQFTVYLKGSFKDEKTFVLDEDFEYSDGSTQDREWTIKILENNLYEGRAADVVGVAHGANAGQALNWNYTLSVPVDGDPIEIQFDDWMFLQNDKKTLINKATMSKFGVYVGEVLIFFIKDDESTLP